jgi:glyoxylase-like metal-dependent hydrolase (beta-lactamase superfamily II)/8-oxo-dGTP pyrophosphatase MutT (NUDIX family)
MTAPVLGAPPTDRPPRQAATLVVVREGTQGAEVLLLRRAERGDHNSGAWVFPGGMVEAGDRESAGFCTGLGDAAASARLGVERDGLSYYVAAVRECFEECGLLFANDKDGELVALPAADDWRLPLHRGERTMAQFCEAFGLTLAVDRIAYYAHWLTPKGMPKRFDTRFFVAEAPPAQTATHDDTENVELRWLRPSDVLSDGPAYKLLTPTLKTLQHIARLKTAQEFLAFARAARDVPLTEPRLGDGQEGRRPVLFDEPAYAELGRLDSLGLGIGCYEIQTDIPVKLSQRVIRVTAGNGSVMTGPGTNTYLIGGGARNEWAVIDPGPLDDAHVQAVLAAAPGPIRWIFATHTHLDHSPGTAALKGATGAPVHGRLPKFPEWQDATFAPDRPLEGGERFVLDGETTLSVIHTPGHASNHLCYLLEEERTLFTGDHVMQLSTVVINPPDGDMAAYVASLHSLARGESLEWLAPGHGFLMQEPQRVIAGIIAHRKKREDKVLSVMRALGPSKAETLLLEVYNDVPAKLHGAAIRSLRAHLLKLQDESRVIESHGHWSLST